MRDAAVAQRGAAGAVGDDDRMLGAGDLARYRARRPASGGRCRRPAGSDADQIVEGQPGQRDDGRAVERGVVEPVHQMDGAGARRSDADAETPGVFGEAGSHEGGGLFMPDADIADPVLALPQRLDDGIDAVADNAEDMGRAPGDQGFDDDVGSVFVGRKARRRVVA